jgi:hypothetical protein
MSGQPERSESLRERKDFTGHRPPTTGHLLWGHLGNNHV